MSGHAAIFFDRDNTLIEDPGYISRPEQVRLFDDAAEAVARLARAGYRIVVVSNQSGIARGLFSEDDLDAVHRRLQELLHNREASLDAIYSCPYLDGPQAKVAAFRRSSDLCKPAPGMLIQAADDLQLDLERSWMIGDSARDIEAGRRAGCRTVLLERDGPNDAGRQVQPNHVVHSLQEAADLVLQEEKHDSPASEPEAATQQSDPMPPDSSAAPESDSASNADLLAVLTDIRELLDRAHRTRRQQDFSLLRLGGALLQMVAVVAAAWGLFVLSSDAGAATARFTLAAFLQVAALTAMLSERRE